MEQDELNAICDEMIEIKGAIAYRKFEIKQLEEKQNILEIKRQGYLDKMKVNEMILPTCYFGYVTTSRTAFDQNAFRETNPDLFNRFMKTTETTKLQFKLGEKMSYLEQFTDDELMKLKHIAVETRDIKTFKGVEKELNRRERYDI